MNFKKIVIGISIIAFILLSAVGCSNNKKSVKSEEHKKVSKVEKKHTTSKHKNNVLQDGLDHKKIIILSLLADPQNADFVKQNNTKIFCLNSEFDNSSFNVGGIPHSSGDDMITYTIREDTLTISNLYTEDEMEKYMQQHPEYNAQDSGVLTYEKTFSIKKLKNEYYRTSEQKNEVDSFAKKIFDYDADKK